MIDGDKSIFAGNKISGILNQNVSYQPIPYSFPPKFLSIFAIRQVLKLILLLAIQVSTPILLALVFTYA